MDQVATAENDITRTYALLGGKETIQTPVRNSLEAHDLLMVGLPTSALLYLTAQVSFLANAGILDKTIGISVRTLQRRKKEPKDNILSVEQSNRTWKFAEVLGRATEILGSKEEAQAHRPSCDGCWVGSNRRLSDAH